MIETHEWPDALERPQHREEERWNPDAERGPSHETYEEKLERWREDWSRELDDDLANGR